MDLVNPPGGHETERELATIYRERYAPLMRVAYLLTGSNETAEDVVQDVFIRCSDRLSTVDEPNSYLRKAVVNACRSEHRRTSREPAPMPRPVAEPLPTHLVELQAALAALNDRQRAAIVLRYFVDIPDTEIAATLDCTPSTVRSLIRRGIAQLREALS